MNINSGIKRSKPPILFANCGSLKNVDNDIENGIIPRPYTRIANPK